MIRLQKFISDCGYCSRRKAEELITAGRVTVNGAMENTLGVKVCEDRDTVCIDGVKLAKKTKNVYIMLNKPKGYLSSVSDDRGRKTVMDLVSDVPYRLFPVGRLDYDTSGMLILTNDGEFTYRITHPKHRIRKTYIAVMNQTPTAESLQNLKKGIQIDDYTAKALEASISNIAKNKTKVRVVMEEGRNREVRRMFEAIGHPLTDLKRVSIGKLGLGGLAPGKWKYLTEHERKLIE